jgi:hypothetical protein
VDDAVFAWAIGKAILIVIISFGTLIYLAWAVTWPKVSENESDQKRRRQTRIRATTPESAAAARLSGLSQRG